MNCVIYARVSTSEQAEKELSIPAQVQAMRDYARQHGWTVVEEFVESGVSARTTARPILQQLLSRVRSADAKIGVVLVHKIDRLARNVYDHAMIKALLKQHGVRLASVIENVDDSVSGQLVENIMAAFAQFYSGNLAAEVCKGMRQKVLKGGWPHLPPRGYVQVRRDDARGSRVELHPKDGPLMRRAFELYAAGWHSLKDVAATIAKEGLTCRTGQPIAAQYLRDLLSNPFYIGRVRWKDLEVAGEHAPLVTRELFDKVQEVMRSRFKDPGAKGSANGFPLRGLAICASCRGHMTAGWQRSAWNRRRWGYYRCARHGYNKALCSNGKGCSAKEAHEAIEQVCAKLHLSPATSEAILKAAQQILTERHTDADRRLNSLRMKRSKLLEREMKLTEGFVAGDISPNAYKTTGAKVKDELRRIESESARLQQSPGQIIGRVEEILKRADTVWELHERLNNNRQFELLRFVFKTIVLDDTGVVGFALRAPFDVIFKSDQDAKPHEVAATIVRSAEVVSKVR